LLSQEYSRKTSFEDVEEEEDNGWKGMEIAVGESAHLGCR